MIRGSCSLHSNGQLAPRKVSLLFGQTQPPQARRFAFHNSLKTSTLPSPSLLTINDKTFLSVHRQQRKEDWALFLAFVGHDLPHKNACSAPVATTQKCSLRPNKHRFQRRKTENTQTFPFFDLFSLFFFFFCLTPGQRKAIQRAKHGDLPFIDYREHIEHRTL